MNLHDPSRPRVLLRPAFLSGHHVVPRLQVWPKDDTGQEVELSLMLPVPDTRFHASWKYKIVNIYELPDLIKEFREDPEDFVKTHFGLDIGKLGSPQGKPAQIPTPPPSPSPATLVLSRDLL